MTASSSTRGTRGISSTPRRARVAAEDRIFVGYAMYCLQYDETVDRLCGFLRRVLRKEHVGKPGREPLLHRPGLAARRYRAGPPPGPTPTRDDPRMAPGYD